MAEGVMPDFDKPFIFAIVHNETGLSGICRNSKQAINAEGGLVAFLFWTKKCWRIHANTGNISYIYILVNYFLSIAVSCTFNKVRYW